MNSRWHIPPENTIKNVVYVLAFERVLKDLACLSAVWRGQVAVAGKLRDKEPLLEEEEEEEEEEDIDLRVHGDGGGI
jgi:hypothetical protein